MDMESWRSDKYSNGRYKRGSSSSSGGGTHTGYSSRGDRDRGETSPYQSGLYDSWKTEWNPTYKDYQTTHYPYPTSSYMTKGGRRSVLAFPSILAEHRTMTKLLYPFQISSDCCGKFMGIEFDL